MCHDSPEDTWDNFPHFARQHYIGGLVTEFYSGRRRFVTYTCLMHLTSKLPTTALSIFLTPALCVTYLLLHYGLLTTDPDTSNYF